MENFKKQAEQISFLDRDIDKARKQERDFEEAIVALQAEVEATETENAQLKRLLRKYEGRGIAAPIKRPTHQHSGSILDNDSNGSLNLEGADVGSNRDLLIQIDSLKSALRYLRSENSSLRTRAALQDLGLTPDASALSGPLGRVDGKSNLIDSGEGAGKRSADTELKAVALETKRLIKDARLICASPKIVDLTKHTASSASVSTPETPRRHWQAQQTRPEWQYHTQQAALHTIQQRSNELKERLAKFSRSTAVPAPSKLKKVQPHQYCHLFFIFFVLTVLFQTN